MLDLSTTSAVRVPLAGGKCLVYGGEAEHCAWAAKRMGYPDMRWPSDTVTIGVEHNGRLQATALFNLFMGAGCSAHIATDGGRAWASRSVLSAFFAYPFLQCGLARITLPIARRNVPSQVLALKLGFAFEGRLAKNHQGDDEILLGMLRDECPWLPKV